MTPEPGLPLDQLLDLAVRTARDAGALALRMWDGVVRGETGSETKSTPTDVVTAADRAVEQLVAEALAQARPDDGLLGEEGGGREGTSGLRWVVDPIDGTTNYTYGVPQWAVSIAAQAAGRSVVGVVYDAAKGEMFTAVRGGGAFLDGQRLRCSTETRLAHALVTTGFGYAVERRAAQAAVLPALLPQVRDVRRFGASSLDLCAVAAGRTDAYYEQGLSPWDRAAGGLVAEEAGARVEGLHGRPAGFPLTIAAAPGVFAALHDLLAAHDADTDPVGDFPTPDPYAW